MYLWWSLCTLCFIHMPGESYCRHKDVPLVEFMHLVLTRMPGESYCGHKDVPLVEFMHLVLTRMPGESYRRRLRSTLLCLCEVVRAPVNSLVC